MRHSIGALERSAFLGPPEATDITGGEKEGRKRLRRKAETVGTIQLLLLGE